MICGIKGIDINVTEKNYLPNENFTSNNIHFLTLATYYNETFCVKFEELILRHSGDMVLTERHTDR